MYQLRRNEVLQKMGNHSCAVICSGVASFKVGDEKYPFEVDRDFYYLTGLTQENMILLLIKHENRTEEVLFIERFDELMAKWVGAKLLPNEASQVSNIQDVQYIDELDDKITQFMRFNGNAEVTLYGVYCKQEKGQEPFIHERIIKDWKKCYPLVSIKQLRNILTEMRIVKSDDEVELLKKGIEVTNKGIQAMMKNVRVGMNEAEVEAHFNFEVRRNLCKHSFPSIVASGINATILHYVDNNSIIEDDSLVLTDLGASYKYYNADITRTFPANGTFTARQKEIYEIVLAANKMIIEEAKIGMTLRELNDMVIKFYEVELPKVGLTKDVRTYYFHGVSHMLGLETHDVSLPNYKIQPGNIFTVEPGLYIEEEKIGIRIEDNVLVTKDGCVNLSVDIIKEVSDIEDFMRK